MATHTTIPVEILSSHMHLSERHMEALFGSEYKMQIREPRRGLKGQFIYKETVRVVGPDGSIDRMAIYGPTWENSHVELTHADAKMLGIKAPVLEPHDLRGAADCMLQGPFGVVELTERVITPTSRLYVSPDEASRMGVRQNDVVKVCLSDDPRKKFNDVTVRVHPTYNLLFEYVPGVSGVALSKSSRVQIISM